MTTLIVTEDYDEVRAALDVSLSKAELPDSVIAQRIYEGAALAELIDRYPDAETETDEDIIERLRRALVFLIAARLAPAVVRITAITITRGDVNFSRQTFDPKERAEELRALADLELAEILEPSATSYARPTMFTKATGGRATV